MPLLATHQDHLWAPTRVTHLYHLPDSLPMRMLGMARILQAWLVACLVPWELLDMAQQANSRQVRQPSAQQPWWLLPLLQQQRQQVWLLSRSNGSRKSWVDSMDRWGATSSFRVQAMGCLPSGVLHMVLQQLARWEV